MGPESESSSQRQVQRSPRGLQLAGLGVSQTKSQAHALCDPVSGSPCGFVPSGKGRCVVGVGGGVCTLSGIARAPHAFSPVKANASDQLLLGEQLEQNQTNCAPGSSEPEQVLGTPGRLGRRSGEAEATHGQQADGPQPSQQPALWLPLSRLIN